MSATRREFLSRSTRSGAALLTAGALGGWLRGREAGWLGSGAPALEALPDWSLPQHPPRLAVVHGAHRVRTFRQAVEATAWADWRSTFFRIILLAFVLAVLVLAWLSVLVTLHRWKADLVNNHLQITRQAAVRNALNRVFQETITCENSEEVARTCLAVAQGLTSSKF